MSSSVEEPCGRGALRVVLDNGCRLQHRSRAATHDDVPLTGEYVGSASGRFDRPRVISDEPQDFGAVEQRVAKIIQRVRRVQQRYRLECEAVGQVELAGPRLDLRACGAPQ